MKLGHGARISLTAALALALPCVALSAGPASAAPPDQDKRQLTVMTQNLYLGSSLDAALAATTPEQFVGAVAQIYGTMVDTDFHRRADVIADTVAEQRPDLIGLQEVSNWTARGASEPPSYDFLAILQTELEQRGLDYQVASTSNNADIGPAPLVAPVFGCGVPPACDVRLQDRDVILVNSDTSGLSWSNPQDGRYDAQQTFTSPVGEISFDRGWASIDGTYQGKSFRFANTHLEVEGFADVQEAQAREFLAGPARGAAVIATGDFNSAADGSTTTSYADLTRSWFTDSWSVNPGEDGFSCCQNSTLTNPTSELHSRIDLVLTHGALRPLSAELVGDQLIGFAPPLWPSDHAGVVATVRLH